MKHHAGFAAGATLGQIRAPKSARARLHKVEQFVEKVPTGAKNVTVEHNGASVPLTPELVEALRVLSRALESGEPITFVIGSTNDTVLSSQEAADLLNVSRPYVVKLAKERVLPHTMAGNRHRFLLSDVLAYDAQMTKARDEALAALAPADGYVDGDF